MRGHDEIVVLNDQITNWCRRKIELQRLPALAIVERNVDAGFRAGKQQAFAHSVFAHGMHVSSCGNSVDDLSPRFAEVVRAIDVRRDVVHLVTVDRDVSSRGVMRRSVDQTHHAPRRQIMRRDVVPGCAVVARQLDQAVVGADPNRPRGHRRRRNRVNHALRAFLFFARPQSEIGTDNFPRIAAVRSLHQKLRRLIERVRRLKRERDRRGPWITMLHLRANLGGRRRDVLHLSGLRVETEELAAGAAAVNNLRVHRIGKDVTTFAGADRMPIAKSDLAVVAAADHRRRAAVLLRAVDPVRKLIVDRDVIKLRGRLVVPGAPGLDRRST